MRFRLVPVVESHMWTTPTDRTSVQDCISYLRSRFDLDIHNHTWHIFGHGGCPTGLWISNDGNPYLLIPLNDYRQMPR